MSQMRHKDHLDGIIRWMSRRLATIEQAPVTAADMLTWIGALVSQRDDIIAREKAIITAETIVADHEMDRLDAGAVVTAEDAAFGVGAASALVRALAIQAVANSADHEAADIDRMACGIIDTLDTLARGFKRPAASTEHPLKGA